MAVLKPRTRLVYFRISEDEYQMFSNLCESGVARSLSDLARVGVQRMLEGAGAPETKNLLVDRLAELDSVIHVLNERLAELNGKLSSSTWRLEHDRTETSE